jgi:hypothetical protein
MIYYEYNKINYFVKIPYDYYKDTNNNIIDELKVRGIEVIVKGYSL